MIRLMNTAMMPQAGTYVARRISQQEFVDTLRLAAAHAVLESYIGYTQTAGYIERISGIHIEFSRAQTILEHGDQMLVCRLRYRVNDPETKGRPVNEEEFEFFLVDYREK